MLSLPRIEIAERGSRVGDEQIDAGPGTVVSAPDPAQTRTYRALAPNTRIVCVGTGAGEQDWGGFIEPV